MQVWQHCTVDTYYSDREALLDEEGYIVRLSDAEIEIAYDD